MCNTFLTFCNVNIIYCHSSKILYIRCQTKSVYKKALLCSSISSKKSTTKKVSHLYRALLRNLIPMKQDDSEAKFYGPLRREKLSRFPFINTKKHDMSSIKNCKDYIGFYLNGRNLLILVLFGLMSILSLQQLVQAVIFKIGIFYVKK